MSSKEDKSMWSVQMYDMLTKTSTEFFEPSSNKEKVVQSLLEFFDTTSIEWHQTSDDVFVTEDKRVYAVQKVINQDEVTTDSMIAIAQKYVSVEWKVKSDLPDKKFIKSDFILGTLNGIYLDATCRIETASIYPYELCLMRQDSVILRWTGKSLDDCFNQFVEEYKKILA